MAPVQDYEKSEIPKDYLYIQHPRYDIHGCHRTRQVIVNNNNNNNSCIYKAPKSDMSL